VRSSTLASITPALILVFVSLVASETMFETRTIESLYRDLPPLEFSQRVMARAPQALAVLAVDNLEWSDLGEPRRVLSLLKRIERTGRREQLARAIRIHYRRTRGAA
jgi:hypothetical protein